MVNFIFHCIDTIWETVMSNTNSILFKQLHKQFEDTKYVDDLRKHLKSYLDHMLVRQTHYEEVVLYRKQIELILDLIEDRYGT